MKKIISSLRSAAVLWLLALLVLASLSGVAYGKYVGRKDVATGLTLTVQSGEHRLISGPEFKDLIRSLGTVKSIVFDRMNDSYRALVSNVTPKPVAVDPNDATQRSDAIRLYSVNGTNGRTLYVLSDGDIVANENCESMFSFLGSCTEITFNNFDTSRVTNMHSMFFLCSKLSTLDLSSFDTAKVTDMGTMFSWCSGLTTIKVSDKFTTGRVSSSDGMFALSRKLKGGAGTTYNDSNPGDKTYARMDGGTVDPGYFTGTSVPTYVLIKGSDLAALISNKAAVKRVVFDWMSDSYTDIVSGVEAKPVAVDPTNEGARWPDISMYEVSDASGGITVYVLSSCKIIGNSDCNSMFSGLTGCEDFTFNNFDATKVDYMKSMFEGCSTLTSLDLSSFYTHRAKDMESMFNGCVNLESLDVSHFNVGQVTSTGSMFRDCSSLTHLDLYSFNTSRVTNMSYMFENCEKLETIEVTFAFVTDGVSSDGNMFKGCDSLVGGAGTTYNSSQVGKLYARIDIPPNTPGYFTAGPGILVRSAPAKVGAYVNFEGRGIEVNPAS